MTQPTEESIRAACEEAGVEYTNPEPTISYTHKDDTRVRFVQYAKDRVPKWAIDIQPHPPKEPT